VLERDFQNVFYGSNYARLDLSGVGSERWDPYGRKISEGKKYVPIVVSHETFTRSNSSTYMSQTVTTRLQR
jgi:hypothetical protein